MYYAFQNRRTFLKLNKKELQIYAQNNQMDLVFFKKIPGIPNPWFCHRVDANGKKLSEKVYKYLSIGKYLDRHYKKKSKSL